MLVDWELFALSCMKFVQPVAYKPIHHCNYSLISDGVFKNSVADYTINVVVFTISAVD